MNIKKLKLLSILVVVFGFLCSTVFSAGIPDKNNRQIDKSLMKPTGTPLYQILNINNITTWMRSDGQQNHSPTSDNGSLYPRGTKWVIYQDGFVWGGKPYLDAGLTTPATTQPIRVGGQTYNIGTRAGSIIGTGAAAVAESPALPDVRIYRVRRDYAQMDIQELIQDAAESFEIPASSVTKSHTDQIAAQYAKDWDEWRVSHGAPYIERNGVSGYQKPKTFNYDITKGALFTTDSLIAGNYDEPGLAGADPNSPADQVIWTVINDLDRSASTGLFGSEPLGLEAQITLWGYKRTDAMGNLYFKKIKFINKGGVDIGGGTKGSFYIDSMFFAQWSDPDLGSYGDDLCGVDMNLFPPITGTPNSLGFVYNGNAIDAEFKKFGLQPPAVGYDFLQGPLVAGTPTDSGVFNLKRVYGKKNLPMTSFAYFSAGSGISDPPFTYVGALRWWRMLQGFVPEDAATWRLYPHPPGVTETKFPLNGDPVARTGFIDGLGTLFSFAPGDRRIVMNTGPFTLAPGDTQEVVVGTVAGLGADRLSSINVMKFYDQFVQTTYDALFQVTPSPAPPAVKIAELDGEITLEWGSDIAAVNKTENTVSQPGAFIFEGYNVYQLPSRSASLSEAKRLATFDLLTQPTVILDRLFDKKSGEILMLPVQFGTNSGISRYFKFDRDYILDIDKLNNGQEYYLAVTAYSRTTVTDFLPTALESSPIVYTVRPQSSQGVRYAGKYGVNASFINVGPFTDGFVKGKVVNPKQTTGNIYEVTFAADAGAPGGFTWSLRDSIKKTTWGPYTNLGVALGGDIYDYPIIDGIFWEVAGPPNEVNDCVIGKRGTLLRDSASNYNYMETTSGGTGPLWVGEGGTPIFGGVTTSRAKMADMKNVYIVFDETVPAAQRMAYRYVRAGQNPKANPRFADPPYGRATYTTTSWGYCDTMPVPFRAFRYDPDAGITTPIQLAVGFSENNVAVTATAAGWVDGRYTPTNVGDGGREFMIIFGKPYDAAMNQDEYKYNILGTAASPYGAEGWHDAHFVFWMKNSRKFDLTDVTAFPAGSAVPPIWSQPDTIFITANHVLSAAVKFIVQSPAITSTPEFAKLDAEKVGVYPNPYYAFNPAETNRFVRFVTFNKLPPKATVRIFNLAGQLVRTLTKEEPSQFMRWDLNNENNFPVASGIYVAHVDMPDVGVTKILKVAIIQEQEVPDVF